jgi:cyclohexanone monooxygenase
MAASARLSAGAAPRVAVLGAGPAGLAAGHELTARGLADFTIFEATDAVGGTWHTHSYPGLACDVWAHSYTFSYRPNPDWSASFVEGPEIEAYLQRCAREFGLESKIRLGTRIIDARWSEDGTWTLTSEDGRSFPGCPMCRGWSASRGRVSTPPAGTTTPSWRAGGCS